MKSMIFGIHNHQPVGNFDFVFEDAYQRGYNPFIDVLIENPTVKFNIHFTGCLLEWIEKKHPDFFEKLRFLIKNNTLEILTGGYYEPILPIIPDIDKKNQILKLTDYIEKKLKYHPIGMWLAERIWEPHLPKHLKKAGIEYILIDDTHFKQTGMDEDEINSYYITEESGYDIKVFPINKKLRYTMPYAPLKDTTDYLDTFEDGSIITSAHDGEKFGVWPGSYNKVFKKKWLDKFFKFVLKSNDINLITFSDAIENYKSNQRIYLPATAYEEMNGWTLPAKKNRTLISATEKLRNNKHFKKINSLIHGGFWRSFLSKYPESNNMHKKMLEISYDLQVFKKKMTKKHYYQTRDHLMAGQCNCPYWHGAFGGIYLPHLRTAIYENLISAEKIIDKYRFKNDNIEFYKYDYNKDSYDEIKISTKNYNLYFMLSGGYIYEFDFKKIPFNIQNNFTVQPEYYHDISKQKIDYDDYFRGGLIDQLKYKNIWYPLYNLEYVPYQKNEKLILKSYFYIQKNRIDIEKKFIFKLEKIIVKYKINSSEKLNGARLFIENNYSFLAGHAKDRYYFSDSKMKSTYLDSKGTLKKVNYFGIIDEFNKILLKLKFSNLTKIKYQPIFTFSNSEHGYERIYQCSAIRTEHCLNEMETNISFDIELKKIK